MNWYVINITSGFEQRIKNTIETQSDLRELDKKIIVPVIKRKRYLRDKLYFFSEKIFPGYVFISCGDKDVDTLFSVVANIPGIINMSCVKGARRFYDVITDEEMYHVLELITDNKEKVEQNNDLIQVSMKVRVIDGPFSSFQGIVTDVNKSGTKETRVKITTSLFDSGISTIVIPISFIEPI